MANSHSLNLEAGSSQYAWKNEPTGLDLTGDLTVELWVKPETLTDFQMLIIMGQNGEAESQNVLFALL